MCHIAHLLFVTIIDIVYGAWGVAAVGKGGMIGDTMRDMSEENMTEQAILAQVQQNKEALEKIYTSVEKTRKMFLWTLILSFIGFILPIIGLAFAIPYFLSTYVSALSGFDLGL